MALNHRYLDVMTVRPSKVAVSNEVKPQHSSLLIEPILMPNLDHAQIDHEKNNAEPCLFYPNGDKNKNIRREIEHTLVKHHLIEQSKIVEKHKKEYFRIKKKNKFAHVQGPPLYYGKKYDPEVHGLLTTMKETERKIHGTTQLRL
eukprot:CAMPEP_0174959344 /NCGR_PEP_ID=MMETSP0004_2-20121128/3126_1 /TAXON_ID=420556 /ORGANISM="Ochromonas sp., Strain CCMP1393" /LENGTH=144 /DNA_ID=CAMNT_0016207655 /DNA_START=45 /DNA_END=479 /DNA_ORIENTATION=-